MYALRYIVSLFKVYFATQLVGAGTSRSYYVINDEHLFVFQVTSEN